MKDNQYTSSDIGVLDEIEYVRLRTHNYFGNMQLAELELPIFRPEGGFDIDTFTIVPATLKAIDEIIDNSIDEFHQMGGRRRPLLKVVADTVNGTYSVSDNGRGIPIDKHPTVGKHTPEVIFGMLHSGRNFVEDKAEGVRGQNGVGGACVNFTSSTFNIEVMREGKRYTQEFKEGVATKKPRIIKGRKNATGTKIEFTLDPKIFKQIEIPEEIIISKCIEITLNNPNIKIELTINGKDFTFDNKDFTKAIEFYFSGHNPQIITDEVSNIVIIPKYHEGDREKIFGWANSGLLLDGGQCNTQLSNSFFGLIEEEVMRAPQIRQISGEIKLDRGVLRNGVLMLNFVEVSDPQYDAQHKTRFVGPCLRQHYRDLIEAKKLQIRRNLSEWISELATDVEEAYLRTLRRASTKRNREVSTRVIPGFLDATTKNRSEAMVMITEGTSASNEIRSVRDPKIHAVFEQRGKVNNVHGSSVAQVKKMVKYSDMLAVLNLVPGVEADKKDVPYGKIIIATDADYDGDDIFTLNVNMFYTFWPELLREGTIIYRLMAPNIVAFKGKDRVHFKDKKEYDKMRSKLRGYSIEYMKGLGSMEPEDWKMILKDIDRYLIPIEDDGNLAEVLDLLFNKARADDRKEWLSNV